MPGISDLFGRHGILEQLLLWSVVSEVVRASMQPSLTAVAQDISARFPELAIDPATAADLAARGIITVSAGQAEAARGGINASRWHELIELHTVRLSPADLAEAVLRSYMPAGEAEAQARPQGVTPAMFGILTDLAGDAIGPQQAAEALRRKLIPQHGAGAASVSFDQAIAESRLHNKWGPILAELSKVLLSPPEAASAVVRNFLEPGAATHLAELQGVDAATFQLLVRLSGDAPAPIQLAEALRRGLVPADGKGAASTSFTQGIAEGRLADKWAPVIKGLAQLWPTPTDALDAQVKGQLTEAEGSALYVKLGGDPQFHDWLLHTIGEGPTPLEAARLAARGIIPEHGTGPESLSYDQAVRESRFRDKWTEAYRRMAEHIPEPSTIVTMLAHRAIDTQQAHRLLLEDDMTPELAAAYIAEAEYEASSDYRGLSQSSVLDMYYAQLLSADQAVSILEVLHVTERAARLLIGYVDLRRVVDNITTSVRRIGTLVSTRKIAPQTAIAALTGLGVPPASAEKIVEDWQLVASAEVKTLTEGQITDAFKYSIMDEPTAMAELEAIGYTPYDAWVLLSLKARGPLPGGPARLTAPAPPTVTPGVT